jgi:hypothetical protein
LSGDIRKNTYTNFLLILNRKYSLVEVVEIESQATLDYYNNSCQKEIARMDCLSQKRIKLEALIGEIQSNDKNYLRIKHTAQQQVERILTDSRQLLKLALVSITRIIVSKKI